MESFKIWIKTRRGYDRFELVLAENEEEVRRAFEGTLKSGEKIKRIEKG
jgi:hypothetical protein